MFDDVQDEHGPDGEDIQSCDATAFIHPMCRLPNAAPTQKKGYLNGAKTLQHQVGDYCRSRNRNLEPYADYHNRIERGRSLVRHRARLDLQMHRGAITALVQHH